MSEQLSTRSCETSYQTTGRVTTICKPEGTYSVIYANHARTDRAKHLPNSFNGFFAETGTGLDYISDTTDIVYFLRGTPRNPNHRKTVQHLQTFKVLEDRHVPIYFTDLYIDGGKAFRPEIGIFVAEFMAGIGLVANIGNNAMNNRQSRRDLLKGALAAWALSPRTVMHTRSTTEMVDKGMAASAEAVKLTHLLHPEVGIMVTTLRNSVIAQKEQWLMEQMGTKPHFVTNLGALHAGVETEIQKPPSERLAYIRMTKPIWADAVNPETLYKIYRMDFDGQNWVLGEIFEEPSLKKLATA